MSASSLMTSDGTGEHFTSTLHDDTYTAINPEGLNLSGRTVLITGASKGIGRAIGISYATAGASQIAIGARSDLASLEKDIYEAAKASAREVKVLRLKLDVTDSESIEKAVAEVERTFGRLDILVNNAGAMEAAVPIAKSDPEAWWNTWTVNIRGPYLVTRACLPLLLKGGEKQIINMSSVGAFLAWPGLSAYQPTKLALLRFSDFINAEYGSQGVIAYSTHPGAVMTELVDNVVPDELREMFTNKPELAADTIVFLTSEKRTWLAGRYISCTWDMPEFLAKKEAIVAGDKLKLTLTV